MILKYGCVFSCFLMLSFLSDDGRAENVTLHNESKEVATTVKADADKEEDWLTFGFFPRLTYLRGEGINGISREFGVSLSGLESFEFGCSHGCGGFYAPTLKYGYARGVNKYSLSFSLIAGIGGFDIGPTYYKKANGNDQFGIDVTVRALLVMTTLTYVKGEAKLNIGFGI